MSAEAEAETVMDGINEITFAYYKCTGLIVPSIFSGQDMKLHKRNAYCFGGEILHFEKEWLMKETDLPQSPAIKDLLRGLKSTVDLDVLNAGFHAEKSAFLQVVNVLQLFCSKITLSANTYNTDDLQNVDGDKIAVNNLGMGIAETWRGVPDGRLRGNALESVITILSGSVQPQSSGSNGTTTSM